MLHVLYLVFNLADPAVRRRVMMLKAGGANVTLAGFRRTAEPLDEIEGIRPIDLGISHDGQFAQRVVAVLSAAASLSAKLKGTAKPDVIVARNLEMLALAARAKAVLGAGDLPVAYESLDIHRLLLRQDPLGKGLRFLERYFARNSKLLITSSPAFVRNYFLPRGQVSAPVELVENKHFELTPTGDSNGQPAERIAPPWRIGWFGALRCRRSLAVLSEFSRRSEGRFQVTLRGRPALREFEDFAGAIACEPFLSFDGPYRNPEDLSAIYGKIHFSWVIDFFEEGQNSKWLLPNRLYEGCRFGAVPIAMRDTETARFLEERGLGIILPEATPDALERAVGDMDWPRYRALRSRILAVDRKTWSCDRQDCIDFVARLNRLAAAPPPRIAQALAQA
ncbi:MULTISPECIES: glycosyl transferase family 1 [Chelativorans]|jgi:succinoglycan biosynthesis protein ExoL|uniref:Glycosyltransferase, SUCCINOGLYCAN BIOSYNTHESIS PROTEIN EXOL n=1 Tax=Chelativorans sp. (strain BNC1) TaxID=266779 RepID=Q11KL9_CHESB|nr:MULTISPECIES: glycosyl transferase family 1 [Chelativorans]